MALKGIVPVDNSFTIHSIHGHNKIDKKCIINLFGVSSSFFILENLSTFDGIIGLDLLNRVNAKIDLKNGQIRFDHGVEKMKFLECKDVHFMGIANLDVPLSVKGDFQKMMRHRVKAFADPKESLPYNTNIIATIRTEDNEPVYSKMYPYPMGVAEFVNSEIRQLLANGIITSSRSPYNSPVWIVDKRA